MRPATQEEIQVIREDLAYLVNDWPSGEIKDDEIRRASTVLRRLITYKDVIKIWVTVVGKKEFVIEARGLQVVDRNRLREIDFATCCEIKQPGLSMSTISVRTGAKDERFPYKTLPKGEMPLKRYIDQTSTIIQGVPINRNEIIQFVANKMGGAHFDNNRQKPKEVSINAMQQYVLADRPALIYMMLSFGQDLASSPSVTELLTRLKNA